MTNYVMNALKASFDEEFNEKTIPLDPNNRFVYAEFMNNNERQSISINDPIQTIIIIDTTTHYFNASKLCASISSNGYLIS